ncbi:hypothetical protein G3576_30535 [Roseomonas stagni]|uniref:Lipoprotein n=1 Tax=Falsiroseomonas algicola TaxID=2716930 RepID=A0A6M1LV33_9PROT|nr:hypothetical protein [Falsiroseomonas algicola]NGM24365.1 hypothetical protein [Falsiroseomonas algicola]
MSLRSCRAVLAGAGLVLTVACAGNPSEPPVRIAVTTTPVGATCEARRDGQAVGRVAPTPGLLRVTNSASPIQVSCDAPAHATGRTVIASRTDGSTAGLYFLAGGLIGLAAASATGAMYAYPADTHVALVPQSFPDVTQRDAFFDPIIARLREQVSGTTNDAPAVTLMEAEIVRLEGLRQAARIGV